MSRRARILLPALLALSALLPPSANAGEAVSTEMDPLKAARAVKIAEKLRCLVCQNQTIADSNAELANDLRGQVRELIATGKSDDQILAYMVARYGDFVLYDPPFKPTTTLLWAGPALLVVAGATILFLNLRRRRQAVDTQLTDDEHERAARLLAGEQPKEDK